jgi:drug/metabolite transporter (DMT)-like permease
MAGKFRSRAHHLAQQEIRNTAAGPSDHQKGLIITLVAGFILTFDTPLIRLAGTDQWTVMFWRSSLTAYAILLYWSFRAATGRAVAPLTGGWYGIIVGAAYGISNSCFVVALSYTSVANVVFNLALIPMFAAFFSFFLLRERPATETIIAFIICLLGVSIIIWEGFKLGSTFGDFLAFSAAITMGLGFTVTRVSGRDFSMIPAIGAIVPLALSGFFITKDAFFLTHPQWFWLGLDGLFVVPVSAALFALAPKYITAPEVAMFFLIETVLAPVWVWLVVSEEPGKGSIAGGAIILITLAVHSYIRMQRTKTTKPAKSA